MARAILACKPGDEEAGPLALQDKVPVQVPVEEPTRPVNSSGTIQMSILNLFCPVPRVVPTVTAKSCILQNTYPIPPGHSFHTPSQEQILVQPLCSLDFHLHYPEWLSKSCHFIAFWGVRQHYTLHLLNILENIHDKIACRDRNMLQVYSCFLQNRSFVYWVVFTQD